MHSSGIGRNVANVVVRTLSAFMKKVSAVTEVFNRLLANFIFLSSETSAILPVADINVNKKVPESIMLAGVIISPSINSNEVSQYQTLPLCSLREMFVKHCEDKTGAVQPAVELNEVIFQIPPSLAEVF